MKYVYLSYVLNEDTPAYGWGDALNIVHIKRIEKGESCNTSLWHLPNHLGTHVDAPKHFFQNGNSIDNYTPDFWIFKNVSVVVIKPNEHKKVSSADIVPFLDKDTDLLLIKSHLKLDRRKREYWETNYGLSSEIGYELRTNYPKVRAIGVDSISISSWQNRSGGKEAHRVFLDPDGSGNPILLIEDMDLSQIQKETKINKVIVMPLRIKGADGAPCSVIAKIEEDE